MMMDRLKHVLAQTCLVFGLLLAPAIAGAEYIPSYDVDITVLDDGSFDVEEVIYYDFGRNYKHGITRNLPIIHAQDSSAFYKERYVEVSVEGIQYDDGPGVFLSSEQGGELLLRIGDPVMTITGEHKYALRYNVQGGLYYFTDAPTELYWNAIGTGWSVPIEAANVTIHDPGGLITGPAACYVGAHGETTNCPEPVVASSTYSYMFADLGAGQGVTIAYALSDTVPRVVLEETNAWYFIAIVVALGYLLFGIRLYRYQTEFKTGAPVIAQYEPYEKLGPMYAGVLLDDTLNPHDITACIVYLAERGYLSIKKTSRKAFFLFEVDDYAITLTKDPSSITSSFQRDVLKLIFDEPMKVGDEVALSKLSSNMSRRQENQKLLLALNKAVRADLVSEGYILKRDLNSYKLLGVIIAVAVAGMFMAGFLLEATLLEQAMYDNVMMWSIVALILLLPILLAMLIFSRRRTTKGYEARNYLLGFKDFLSTTEKERYTFHNAPKKSPEQFMAFLPYAIAFGVEDEWAELFKDITIPDPEWYQGGQAGSFSATNLTKSLGAFSTAFASSSGSSGGGSGGGGSVGGGGGGGGGGSW